MWGSQAALFLLPERDSAVVVVQNENPSFDSADFIAEMLLEALVETPQPHDYVALSREFLGLADARVARVHRLLEENRIPGTHPHELDAYVGRYCGFGDLVCVRITHDDKGLLWTREVITADASEHTFRLKHYHHDVFSWLLPLDEQARKVIEMSGEPEYWLLKFKCDEGSDAMSRLEWTPEHDRPLALSRVPPPHSAHKCLPMVGGIRERLGISSAAWWILLGHLVLFGLLMRWLVRWYTTTRRRYAEIEAVDVKVSLSF
jgi:hypothetical protein